MTVTHLRITAVARMTQIFFVQYGNGNLQKIPLPYCTEKICVILATAVNLSIKYPKKRQHVLMILN